MSLKDVSDKEWGAAGESFVGSPGISEGPLGAGTVLGVGLFGGRDEKSQCFHRELECVSGPRNQQTQINRRITKTGSYTTTKAVLGHREVRELLI